jgi:hypothetical protein
MTGTPSAGGKAGIAVGSIGWCLGLLFLRLLHVPVLDLADHFATSRSRFHLDHNIHLLQVAQGHVSGSPSHAVELGPVAKPKARSWRQHESIAAFGKV